MTEPVALSHSSKGNSLISTTLIPLCYGVIAVFNVLSLIVSLPIYCQLVVNSICCIVIGSFNSVISHEKGSSEKETISKKDTYLLLGYGLLIMAILFIVPQSLPNQILVVGCLVLSILRIREEPISGSIFLVFTILMHKMSEIEWFFYNLISYFVCIKTLENVHFPNFKIGFIITWAFYLYDVLTGSHLNESDWYRNLFGTLPLTLKYPTPKLVGWDNKPHYYLKFEMKDIIIPGLFLALCLRYDFRRAGSNFSKLSIWGSYFVWCLVGYVLCITLSFLGTMYVFNDYVNFIPFCTLLALLLAQVIHKDPKGLWSYQEESQEPVKEEVKEEVNEEHTKLA